MVKTKLFLDLYLAKFLDFSAKSFRVEKKYFNTEINIHNNFNLFKTYHSILSTYQLEVHLEKEKLY